jgi:hypothetical protein
VIVPCNCYALRQAMRRVSQLYDNLLAPLGLRATLGDNIQPLEAQGYLAAISRRTFLAAGLPSVQP